MSKKSQKIANAAAAIHVISQEDIRRSGVTNIADALRMAPGGQVARIDSNKWAVTSRGFNGRFANKLLVLMDGRSLYNTFFLGVYWEVQDTVLEDIERIEVIRGPGAALWGANAVNGVINIITKSAERTKGTLISAGGGSYEQAFATVRQGTALGDNTNLRLYAKHQARDGFVDASGKETYDDWYKSQGGFRLDSQLSGQNNITVQGDYYDGKIKETYLFYNLPTATNPANSSLVQSKSGVSGGNILTRFQRTLANTDNFSLQSYYEHSEYNMLIDFPKCQNLIIMIDVACSDEARLAPACEMAGISERATRHIRALEAAESRSRVTIIAMTGQAITGDRDMFLAAGMVDYLTKPFSLKQVRELLNLWLTPDNCL